MILSQKFQLFTLYLPYYATFFDAFGKSVELGEMGMLSMGSVGYYIGKVPDFETITSYYD
jgi:hypothetical protein